MNLVLKEDAVLVEDLEAKMRDALKNGLPINWELFWKIEHQGGCDHPVYKRVVELFLHFDVLSLEQHENIVLRSPDVTSMQGIGNPRHYSKQDVELGGNPLFFTRDRDAIEYIRTGESLGYLVKGLQAQRIRVLQ